VLDDVLALDCDVLEDVLALLCEVVESDVATHVGHERVGQLLADLTRDLGLLLD